MSSVETNVVIFDSVVYPYKCIELTSVDGVDFDLIFTTGSEASVSIRIFSGEDDRVDLKINPLSKKELDIFAKYKKDEIAKFCIELQNNFNWLDSDEEWISVIRQILKKQFMPNVSSKIAKIRTKTLRQNHSKSSKIQANGRFSLSQYW
jgi:hypothetical protein